MSGAEHWEGVHRSKAADEVSWWQDPEDLWLDLIDDLDLPPDAPILDVGSGSSLLVDALVARGFTHVAAVDISPAALERIAARVGDAVSLTAGDVLDHTSAHPVALWHDRAVFHFLTESSDRERYRRRLHAALDVDGHAIVATFAPDGPDTCSGLPVRKYSGEDLSHELGLRLVRSDRRIHTTPWDTGQPFTVAVLTR